MLFLILQTFAIVASKLPQGAGEECKIPELWDGTWFIDAFEHPTLINSTLNSLTRYMTKYQLGECVWKKDDFYIFYNREKDCSRCILLLKKHSNVFYSKEGHDCMKQSELQDMENPEDSLCEEAMNSQLYEYGLQLFWFKIDYEAIDSPLGEATFEMSYRKNGLNCNFPISNANSCMDHTKMELNYEGCHNQVGTEFKNELLTFFGEWKESNNSKTTYLVADVKLMNNRGTDQRLKDRFRCFIVKDRKIENPVPSILVPHIISGYDVGTVDAASCNGLLDPEDAETTLYMKKVDFFDEPNLRPCKYPSWLASHKWMDMSTTVEFELPFQFQKIKVLPKRKQLYEEKLGNNLFPLPNSRLKCMKITNISSEGTNVAVLAEYFVGCRISIVCLRIVRRSEYIFQLFYKPKNNMNIDSFETTCFNSSLLEFEEGVTMISTRGKTKPCPIQGNYSVNPANNAEKSMKVDVTSNTSGLLSQIFIQSSSWSIGCQSKNGESIDVQSRALSPTLEYFYCFDYWTSKRSDVNYTIVATSTEIHTMSLLCLANEKIKMNVENRSRIYVSTQDCFRLEKDVILDPKDRKISPNYPLIELIETGTCYSSIKSTLTGKEVEDNRNDENNGIQQLEENHTNHSSSRGTNIAMWAIICCNSILSVIALSSLLVASGML